jgi:hypothetical protein
MRSRIVVFLGAVALVAAVAPGVASAKKRSFTSHFLGAQIAAPTATTATYAYQVTDSAFGPGASIQQLTVSSEAAPATGTFSARTFFASGVTTSRGTFTLAVPDAAGISQITGTGHCTGGNRRFQNTKCTFTLTGTYDTTTTVVDASLSGTYRR